MSNIQSSPAIFSRWATLYAIALILSTGRLLFEKISNSRQELAGSVENTFRQSREIMARNNNELLQDMKDRAADYPSSQSVHYKNRAEKVCVLARAVFENHSGKERIEGLGLLRDSIISWTDHDETSQQAVQEIMGADLKTELLPKYNPLKTEIQVQSLTALALNYCYSKVWSSHNLICRFGLIPYFMPDNLNPVTGQAFQAKVCLEGDVDMRCANFTAFLNEQPLSLRDGIATIRTTFPTSGPHTLRLRFRRERCRDGSITEVSRDFQVNVMERCDSIPSR